MKWNAITQKCMYVYQIDLTYGVTPVARKQIIATIAEEFQKIPRVRIAAMVDRSIRNESYPSHIKNLLTYIQSTMR